MKKFHFTDSHILTVLKQAEAGTPVPQLCREHGISSAPVSSDADDRALQRQVVKAACRI